MSGPGSESGEHQVVSDIGTARRQLAVLLRDGPRDEA